MRDETGTLMTHWTGNAAGAFQDHADAINGHLVRVSELTAALVDECEEAARQLRALRTVYAGIGYQRIRQMIDQHAEYVAVTTSAIGRVTECTSPGGAAGALLATVQDYHTALADEQRRGIDAAAAVLRAEGAAVEGGPDFGREYEPVPLPRNDLVPDSTWDDGTQWRPAPGHG